MRRTRSITSVSARPRRPAAAVASAAVLLLTGAALTACSSSSSPSSSAGSGSPSQLSTITANPSVPSSANTSSSSAGTGGKATYDEPVLKVTGAYVVQPSKGTADSASAYAVISNAGRQPSSLKGAISPAAQSVSLAPAQPLTVAAGGRVVLRPGGDHLVLKGLKKKLTTGEKVTLRLLFEGAEPITVSAPVEPTTYKPSN
ncbi:copper chaperone PCu(A)C [Streptomyces beihaiensis]|uniref:Copper chaperone PCu(A)C n=1 Tax=Streptomyces beihaiensis TaxID=2984495 RepID=A0ABT3TPR7_9ACTN|nr:copper chaperone PCu(A)C [Streptomyces beihaiensis]MCX3059032.1 copper chaperone PCu(A)C [Streptomyces beihaiensis]